MSYRAHFSRALAADPERLHFAAHSHHLWPDVTEAAHARAWEDAARLADRKWEGIFGRLFPRVRARIARVLDLPDPDTLALGPNTHDFVVRLFSCFEESRPVRVLTTDAEFHSFARQLARWEEAGRVTVERVPAEPFEDFPARLAAAAARGGHDLVFFSQVHFNSGFVLADPAAVVRAVPDRETFVVIDGYHGFCALPTDLAPIAERAFYLAGGYKYAMAGEGACFLHCPPGYGPRPVDTGWYAGFGGLEGAAGERVSYDPGGARFLGATFDPSGFHRLDAVLGWMEELDLSIAAIHAHVRRLQASFLAALATSPAGEVRVENLVPGIEAPDRGQFLTFRTRQAAALHGRLLERGVVSDYRADRLRFGFALYHGEEDVGRLLEHLSAVTGRRA